MSPNEESPSKKPKRNPKRGAKKDPWDEGKLLTSSESPLIYIDLVVSKYGLRTLFYTCSV